ncbi:AsmA family protein [Polycladidibacter stylochi]|uniref:AsmA family protein n=1 Tax=Polycladidibacter stylochi TaxID=1807766 RepID=UPI0008298E35|nr:AsmA family protein [Pseudovibrio stylochi]
MNEELDNSKPRSGKKRYRLALITIGIGACLALAAFTLLPSLISISTVKEKLANSLYASSGYQLRLDGRSTVSLFPTPVVSVENIGVSREGSPNKLEFLQIGRADFQLSWLSLLQGDVKVLDAELVEPRFFLEVGADGNANWSIAAPKSGDSEKPLQLGVLFDQLGLRRLSLIDALVAYSNKQSLFDLRIDHLKMDVAREGGDAALTFKGEMPRKGKMLRVSGRLGSGIALLNGASSAVEVALSGPHGGSINLAGQLTVSDRPIGSLSVEANIPDSAGFAALFGHHSAAKSLPVSLSGQLRFSKDSIGTQGLGITAGQAHMSSEITLDYLEDGVELSTKVSGRSIPFGSLMQYMGYAQPASGFVDLDVSALSIGLGPVQLIKNLRVDGSAKLSHGRIADIPLPWKTEGLKEDGRTHQAAETLEDIDVAISFSDTHAPMRFDGQGRWHGEPVSLKGELSPEDILDLEVRGEAGLLALTGPSGLFSSVDDGGILAPSFAGHVVFESADIRRFGSIYRVPVSAGLKAKNIKASGVLVEEGQQLKIRDLDAQIANTHIKGSGLFAFGSTPKLSGDFWIADMHFDDLALPLMGDYAQKSIRLGGLRDFDFDLDLELLRPSMGFWHADQAFVRAENEAGKLNLNVSHASLYGGTGEGTFTANMASVTPSYKSEFVLNGLDVAPITKALEYTPQMKGRLFATGVLEAKGDNWTALKESLSGNASLQIGEGHLSTVHLDGLIDTIASQNITGWPRYSEVGTDFKTWGLDVALADGLVRVEGLTMQTPLSFIEGGGKISLKNGDIEFVFNPSRYDQEQVQLGSGGHSAGREVAAAGIIVSGSLTRPQFAKLSEKSKQQQEYTDRSRGGVLAGSSARKLAAQLEAKAALRRETQQTTSQEVAREDGTRTDKANSAPITALDAPKKDAEPQATPQKSLAGGDVDDEMISRVGPVVPLSKPAGNKRNTSVANSELPQEPKVQPAKTASDINVVDVANGDADDEATLRAIEEGFGLDPGFLSD